MQNQNEPFDKDNFYVVLNLLRTAGRFIDQRCKGKGNIISIRIDNKEVTLMQL